MGNRRYRQFQEAENQRFLNKSVPEMAPMVNKDPVDAILDLPIDEDLETGVAQFVDMRTRVRQPDLFDPEAVRLCPQERANDLPGGKVRIIERSEGFVCTIVGGEVVFDHNENQGVLPGRVIELLWRVRAQTVVKRFC